jgi:predicted ferric reductase
MAFHKIAAWWVLIDLLLHPLLYVLPTWLDDPVLGLRRLVAYHVLPQYRSGVIALAALCILVVGSALQGRLGIRYEIWRALHVLLAATAAAAGLHHAMTAGRFSALGALNAWWWVVAAVLSVTPLADRLWELDIYPDPGTPRLCYEAGQFVWITEGARRFPLFDHPFSIAGTPLRPGIRLIVKEAGDFTGRIGILAPGTPIGIDGPHGEFSLRNHPAQAVVLIAGGVGIAPVMGLLRDLVVRRDPRPVRLAYAVGQPANLACLDEIAAAEEVLDLKVMLVSETGGPDFAGEIGRLDRPRLERLLDGLDRRATVAMICGPGPMVAAVSDLLLDAGLPGERIVYERFDYATGPTSRLDRRRRSRSLALGAALAGGVAAFAIAGR